jgi:hypothetical protein
MATRLRRLVSIAVVTMLCDTALVAADYSISVGDTQQRMFPNRATLAVECGTAKRIYACTVFAAERLTCSCARKGERWQLAANARFVPIMLFYLHHPAIIRHEQSHIDDVRESLGHYLEELTSREFTTERACTTEANAVSDEIAFVRRMNDFRRESAAKRDRF